MKTLRLISAVTILSLTLSMSGLAGQVETPGAAAPTPTPTPMNATTTTTTTDTESYSVAEDLLLTVIELLVYP